MEDFKFGDTWETYVVPNTGKYDASEIFLKPIKINDSGEIVGIVLNVNPYEILLLVRPDYYVDDFLEFLS